MRRNEGDVGIDDVDRKFLSTSSPICIDDGLGIHQGWKMTIKQGSLSPLVGVEADGVGGHRGHGEYNAEVLYSEMFHTSHTIVQCFPVFKKDPGPMLLYKGLVLVKVLGDLPDVIQVDPHSSYHRECPRTPAVDELDDDPCFVVDGIINQLALEFLPLQGERGHRNVFDHILGHLIQEWSA